MDDKFWFGILAGCAMMAWFCYGLLRLMDLVYKNRLRRLLPPLDPATIIPPQGGTGAVRPALEAVPEPPRDTFRVRLFVGAGYTEVVLMAVIGELLKVRIPTPTGHIGTIVMAQVHPEDRPRVQEMVRIHPGSSIPLEFDPFDQGPQGGPPIPGH